MVDFQTLTLFSLTLLTAAMFIFYYLLVKARRTPPVTRKTPQTSVESPASVSRSKIENPISNPIQIPIQAPQTPNPPTQAPTQTPTPPTQTPTAPAQVPAQTPTQIKAPIEIPIQTQSQISSQPPVQAISQNSVPAPLDNSLNMPAATPTLSGEAATMALKEFAEELEKGRGPSGEKTPDASLIKLARVLMDVIQADRTPEKPSEQPDQNKQDIESEKKTATVTEPPHKHGHSGKKKKAKMHKQSRTRTASRKAKNKKTKVKVKRKEHRTQAKKNSKQSRATNLHSKRAQKKRRGKN
jgi:hypothetical protein